MYHFKVILVNGITLETIKPIRSFKTLEDFTFFYDNENQKGYLLAAVARAQICSILLEDD